MIKHYFRTALRTLTRNSSISFLNILGLSAGMTAAVLIFLWVQNELSYDNYHPDANQVFRITSRIISANQTTATTCHPIQAVIQKSLPEVAATTSLQPAHNTVFRSNNALFTEKSSAYVDSNWFRFFHYDFIAGNTTDFFRHPYSLILTQSSAKKYFGDKNPIGLTLRKDSTDFTVTAIIRDNPANSSFQVDVLMPMDALLSSPERVKQSMQWGNYNYITFLKLQPIADPKKTAASITTLLYRNKPTTNSKTRISLTPLKAMHLETGVYSPIIAHGSQITVYIFSILGAFLLLIACINYVNLTTARASTRAKEVGIRKIVGAGRNSLFLQFFVESLLISFVSLTITLVLIQLALPLFSEVTGLHFQTPLTAPQTWKILGLTLLTTTLLNGVYPALLLASFQPLNTLKGTIILQFKDVYLRKGLVVLQFTFSIILIAGTIIIQRQLSYVQHTNPGYDRSQVFYFTTPYTLFRGKTDEQAATLTSSIKTDLLAQTGISDAAVASESLVQIGTAYSGEADWAGRDTAFTPTIYELSADEDFNKILDLQLQQGRWFDPKQPTDRHNVILNETAIAEFNIRKPVLGQRFILHGDTGRIIGIAKDFHFASLHEKINPLVLVNHDNTRATFYIKTRPEKATAALAAARATWERYVHDKPFDYTFLDEEFDDLYKTDTKVSTLILAFSAIAILISCLGLLGLATFTARQRTREIGIRKVLGASVSSILVLLSADFLRLIGLSILISIPIAWWAMHAWLQDFAYHIPLSPWAFAGAGLLAIGVAVLTIGTQAARAATSNPVKNLRTE